MTAQQHNQIILPTIAHGKISTTLITVFSILGIIIASSASLLMTGSGLLRFDYIPTLYVGLPHSRELFGWGIALGMQIFIICGYFAISKTRYRYRLSSLIIGTMSVISLSAYTSVLTTFHTAFGDRLIQQTTSRLNSVYQQTFDARQAIRDEFGNYLVQLDNKAKRHELGIDESGIAKRGWRWQAVMIERNNAIDTYPLLLQTVTQPLPLPSTSLDNDFYIVAGQFQALEGDYSAYLDWIDAKVLSNSVKSRMTQIKSELLDLKTLFASSAGGDSFALVVFQVNQSFQELFHFELANKAFLVSLALALLPDVLSIGFVMMLTNRRFISLSTVPQQYAIQQVRLDSKYNQKWTSAMKSSYFAAILGNFWGSRPSSSNKTTEPGSASSNAPSQHTV